MMAIRKLRMHTLPDRFFSQLEEWEKVLPEYDWSLTTKGNHTTEGARSVSGKFADIRETLDFDFHGCYSDARTNLQDQIIMDSVGGGVVSEHPWIIFTAGAMGAGKGHTIQWMVEEGHFPIIELVHVDPDIIRARLPENPGYLQRYPETAGRMTHRESGYCVEIAQEAGLQQSKGVWVDGSLRDAAWYAQVFGDIRRRHPQYRIAIIHVHVPWDKVISRAAERAQTTGRAVPEEELRESFETVPKAVEKLSGLADFTAHIENVDVPRLTGVGCTNGCSEFGGEPVWEQVETCFRQVPCNKSETLATYLDGLTLSHDILIFSKSYCSYCVQARKLLVMLAGAGAVHTLELDHLTLDGAPAPGLDKLRTERAATPVLLQNALQKKTGIRTVPQVFVRGQFAGTNDMLRSLNEVGQLAEVLMPGMSGDYSPCATPVTRLSSAMFIRRAQTMV